MEGDERETPRHREKERQREKDKEERRGKKGERETENYLTQINRGKQPVEGSENTGCT